MNHTIHPPRCKTWLAGPPTGKFGISVAFGIFLHYTIITNRQMKNENSRLIFGNFSHCWAATTAKLMKELNFTPTCPTNDDEIDNSYEVRVDK